MSVWAVCVRDQIVLKLMVVSKGTILSVIK